MAEHPAQTVNREFFLSKVEECIRHADEAALPASRLYWSALADRWRALADDEFNGWDIAVMADEMTEAQEARRLAAEWRMKAAQVENQSTRKCMEQLAADFDALARCWAATAKSEE